MSREDFPQPTLPIIQVKLPLGIDKHRLKSWWRHQMETFSALLALFERNPQVTGGFYSQRSVTRSFDVFFELRMNKRLSKQPRHRWFETPSRSLWRHLMYIRVRPWNKTRKPELWATLLDFNILMEMHMYAFCIRHWYWYHENNRVSGHLRRLNCHVTSLFWDIVHSKVLNYVTSE